MEGRVGPGRHHQPGAVETRRQPRGPGGAPQSHQSRTNPATVDHRFIPHAVFGYPQIASVGLTEEDCRRREIPYVSHVQPYAAAAYGWAMEDTDSVAKVIAHAGYPTPDRSPHHRSAGAHPHPATHPGHALRPDRRPDGEAGSTTSIPPFRRSWSRLSWNSDPVSDPDREVRRKAPPVRARPRPGSRCGQTRRRKGIPQHCRPLHNCLRFPIFVQVPRGPGEKGSSKKATLHLILIIIPS